MHTATYIACIWLNMSVGHMLLLERCRMVWVRMCRQVKYNSS